MPHELIWVAIVVIAIAVLLAVAAVGAMRRRKAPFETHMFPENYIQPYEARINEVERLFVAQPRESVAAAKLLVDDMLTRMGYPVRISNEERVKDLRHFHRGHSDRYRIATSLRSEPTTEDLRRSLQAYLETARELVERARGEYRVEGQARPELAG